MTDYWNSHWITTDKIRADIPEAGTGPLNGSKGEQQNASPNISIGETLQGEIISVKGNEVLVKLADETVISAQLANDMQVFVGQSLIFEVQNGTKGQIMLRALFTNLAGGKLLGSAIEDAGLPLNAKSAEMVEHLMKEELPINKETLQTVYREVVEFSELEPAEIVKMHKLGMEVNETSVKQFAAFLNCEKRIASDTMQLISNLHHEIVLLEQEGNGKQAYQLAKELLALVSQSPESLVSDEKGVDLQTREYLIQVVNELFAEIDSLQPQRTMQKQFDEVQKELLSLLEGKMGEEISPKQILEFLNEKIDTGILPEKALNLLFTKKEFSGLVERALTDLWLLKPSEVEDGKNISDFYQRLSQHVTQLSATAAEAIATSRSLNQSLQQITENVDFLNQLNQMVPYVQLPLKLNGQSATGDLYVFADKKSLAEKGENITAALHLDMQYLGHLDVYVKLVQSKVETDFKVENDATLQFLGEHMNVLVERLKKRGYDLDVNMQKMMEPASLKNDLMRESKTEEDVTSQPIAYYRLDVRA